MFLRYLQRLILGLLPVWMMATSLSFARSSPQVLSSDCATYKDVPLPAEANGIAAPTELEERPKGDFDGEVVHANELARVEGVWNGYRDAWAGFARLRYEGHSDAIVAKIEFDRYRLLKTIGDYD